MYLEEVNPAGVTQADIVVGLASYQEADAIAHPTRQASEGLVRYFPEHRGVVINCDNHSPDGTREAFLGTETAAPKIYITTPPDTPGKGYNFENMFRRALELGAKAIICVDADLESITPEWILHFGQPLLNGYDYVTPIYSRHKYDGTITNNIAFPLIYGLFCRYIRQPIGGDFALSGALARHVLLQPWHLTTEQYGIDIFLSMNAVAGGFKIAEAGLGAKIHKPSAPKLGPMFTQVVSTAFLLTLRHRRLWESRQRIVPCPLFGQRALDPPQELTMDREAILASARQAYETSSAVYASALETATRRQVESAFAAARPAVDQELWISVLFELIAAFDRAADKAPIVEALKALYFARAFTFMNQTWSMSTAEAESIILAQADRLHARRGELIARLKDD